jgi:hypothetical protein
MDGLQLGRSFSRIGARVGSALHIDPRAIRVDVKRDRLGEYFDVLAGSQVRIVVPDVQPDLRHLLLVAHRAGDADKHKFLCGHDERHWFAAAVPEVRGVSGVRTAMEALKPIDVRLASERRGVRSREFASRKTAAYKRQGEWFFLPREDLHVPQHHVHRNEPMRRGGGKAHIAQFAFRSGGEVVYFRGDGREVLSQMQYERLMRSSPEARKATWRTGLRNMDLFVKGRISHPDHATITLDCWHLVRMNTENQAAAMSHLAFID